MLHGRCMQCGASLDSVEAMNAHVRSCTQTYLDRLKPIRPTTPLIARQQSSPRRRRAVIESWTLAQGN